MIEYTRTANAGGLLEMDGVRILLDGVSQAVGDYLATPPDILDQILSTPLDAMAFTHDHCDHFLAEFVRRYAQAGQLPRIIGPKDVAAGLPEYPVITAPTKAGPVQIIAIPSRHMGAEYRDTPHYSFLLKGSSLVWFMGDASPLQWQGMERMPQPDLLIAPFAYASTAAAWQITESLAPKRVLLTHLPSRDQDGEGLWDAVNAVVSEYGEGRVRMPPMGEKCVFH